MIKEIWFLLARSSVYEYKVAANRTGIVQRTRQYVLLCLSLFLNRVCTRRTRRLIGARRRYVLARSLCQRIRYAGDVSLSIMEEQPTIHRYDELARQHTMFQNGQYPGALCAVCCTGHCHRYAPTLTG